MLRLDESADGQEVDLPVGDTLELSLPENPTTGFRWEVVSRGAPECALVGDEFQRGDGAGAVGRGGVHRWRLRAERPGTASLELAYRREWEPEKPPARLFRLRVRVSS